MTRILIVFQLIFIFPAWSQDHTGPPNCNNTIEGKILDAETQEPVPFAAVQIKNTEHGVLADESGYFIFQKICNVEVDLIVSHIGYKSVTHHHDSYHTDMTVELAPDNLVLESVVVEGNQSQTGLNSVSETKLARKELELTSHGSLGDALTAITGVSTLKTGSNIVKPVVHGLYGNRILIINNGLRHESQEWGNDHAPEIDPAMADNITLVKGAAAVKYGPNAMGGIIIINPPKMELSTNHLHGEGGITAGSNGRSINGDILLQEGFKSWAWLAQASGLYQGDMKAPGYQLTNTGARELSYLFAVRFHKKNVDLHANYGQVQQELGILRGSVVGNLDDLNAAMQSSVPFHTNDFSFKINNPRQNVSHETFSLKSTYNIGKSQLIADYGLQINQRQEFDVRKSGNNERPAINLKLYTHSLDLDWLHPEISEWNGKIGMQWLYQDNNNVFGTNTISFVPNYNISRLGIYITESRPVNDLTIDFGLRFDYQNTSVRGRNFNNDIFRQKLNYGSVTGQVGIATPLGERGKLQSGIGTAWRPPNVAELYSYGKHEFSIDYGLWRSETDEFGNINSSLTVYGPSTQPIKNETSLKWVTNYSVSIGKSSMELSAYFNFLSNYIYSKPAGITQNVRGPFPFYVYDQTNATFLGIDASYIIQHTPIFQSQFKGSYLRARDVRNNDFFIGTAANQLRYKLTFSKSILGIRDFSAHIETAYTFRQYNAPRVISVEQIQQANEEDRQLFKDDAANFDFIAAPGGYFLVNAQVRATVHKFILALQIKNILNNSYRDYTNSLRYFADEPGINVLTSVRYKF